MANPFFAPQLTTLPDGKGKHVLVTGATGVVGKLVVHRSEVFLSGKSVLSRLNPSRVFLNPPRMFLNLPRCP